MFPGIISKNFVIWKHNAEIIYSQIISAIFPIPSHFSVSAADLPVSTLCEGTVKLGASNVCLPKKKTNRVIETTATANAISTIRIFNLPPWWKSSELFKKIDQQEGSCLSQHFGLLPVNYLPFNFNFIPIKTVVKPKLFFKKCWSIIQI